MDSVHLDASKLERLLDVGRSLVAERDPDAVLMRVLEAARELTGARYAAMGILDDGGSELGRFLTVGVDEELRRRIGPLPRGHGILGELIRNPRPLRLTRISDHPRSYGFPAEHPPMETFLGVPVRIRDAVYGNLYLTEKAGGAEFDETDEQLLIVLAEWAAVAVDNARAHAQSVRDRRKIENAMRGLEETAALNREMVGRGDYDHAVELVVKRARSLADARTAALLLIDRDALTVAAVAGEVAPEVVGREAPAAGTYSLDVLQAGRGQLLSAEVAGRFTEFNPRGESGVIVPLRARGSDLGVLVVFERLDPDHPFGTDDVLALESFGSSAATRIFAARALEDERVSLSIASSERERQRWARELHDETLQELGALNVMLATALRTDDARSMSQALARSSEQVEQIIAGLQGLITELRPASLDQLGVAAALQTLIERLSSRSGLEIELDLDLNGQEPRLEPELEATIYRLVQEGLTNVVKHAHATRARVKVEDANGFVGITVEDDGHGFEGEGEGGFGLVGMRERVALRGGEFELVSVPGDGTRMDARVPSVRVSSEATT
jgi:signal transduction histidine kinase